MKDTVGYLAVLLDFAVSAVVCCRLDCNCFSLRSLLDYWNQLKP